MLKRLALTGLFALTLFPLAAAQDADAPPDVWYNLDYEQDGVYGMSVDRAYEALEGREPARQIVVAVIDSGVDITHEDLQGQIWTNDDIPGNGVDDDGNGYVDDTHGWNFIGGADGRNIEFDSFELAREIATLRAQVAAEGTTSLSHADAERLDAVLLTTSHQATVVAGDLNDRRLFVQVEPLDHFVNVRTAMLQPT
ncbi:MAG: hypothetical protein IIC18_05545, partial [Bacteroidetes bacterium]|nr:hypothetical protein [Bacteroidota bacterium]